MTRRSLVTRATGVLALTAAWVVPDAAVGTPTPGVGQPGVVPAPANVYDLIVLSPKEGSYLREENYLVHFRSDRPTDVTRRVTVTGLAANNQWLYSIALRPKTNELYALGRPTRLYKIDAFTGEVTWTGPVMADVAQAMSSYEFSMAFDPVADVLRVVSGGAANFRVDPDTGEVIDGDPATPGVQGDGWLTYVVGDRYRQDHYASADGIAYDREGSGVTLYGHFGLPLGRIGDVGGDASSAGTGEVRTYADMPVGGGAGSPIGFTITDDHIAFAVFRGESGAYLARIDLATGDWSPGYEMVDRRWVTGAEIGRDNELAGNGYHALCLSPVQTTPSPVPLPPQPEPAPAPLPDEPPAPPLPSGPPPSSVTVVLDVDLSRPGQDDVTVRGILPHDGPLAAGDRVVVTAGDAVHEFTLATSRRGVDGEAVLRLDRPRHGRVRFRVRLTPEDLADEVEVGPCSSGAAPLPVVLTLDGRTHATEVPLRVRQRGPNRRIARGHRR